MTTDGKNWTKEEFWQQASPSDITRCLDAGADPNARGEYEMTPLHNAAMCGNAETVKALLNAGADPNARSEDDETPLHWAGSAEVVGALLDAGADLNARTSTR